MLGGRLGKVSRTTPAFGSVMCPNTGREIGPSGGYLLPSYGSALKRLAQLSQHHTRAFRFAALFTATSSLPIEPSLVSNPPGL